MAIAACLLEYRIFELMSNILEYIKNKEDNIITENLNITILNVLKY